MTVEDKTNNQTIAAQVYIQTYDPEIKSDETGGRPEHDFSSELNPG